MKVNPKFVVALNLSEHVADLVQDGRIIVQSMTSPNTWFPTPTPTLATVTADINALEAAQVLAETKTMGAAAARDAKQRIVENDLKHLGGYVGTIADANPGQEAVIIKSAGMSVKNPPSHRASVFRATQGDVSGVVVLHAPKVVGAGAHYWQMSSDQKTWTSLPETTKSSTSISGLSPGATYSFRHRVLTSAGYSDWDQIVSIMVH